MATISSGFTRKSVSSIAASPVITPPPTYAFANSAWCEAGLSEMFPVTSSALHSGKGDVGQSHGGVFLYPSLSKTTWASEGSVKYTRRERHGEAEWDRGEILPYLLLLKGFAPF